MRSLLVTVLLGLPWLLGQLYLPLVAPITGLALGVGDLVQRSRWRASERAELEEQLRRALPGEAPPDGRAAAMARAAAERAEREARLSGHVGLLVRGLLGLATAAGGLGLIFAYLVRRRLAEPRRWLAGLDGLVAALGGAMAILSLALGDHDAPLLLSAVCCGAGLVAAAGWLFFEDELSRFVDR